MNPHQHTSLERREQLISHNVLIFLGRSQFPVKTEMLMTLYLLRNVKSEVGRLQNTSRKNYNEGKKAVDNTSVSIGNRCV